MDERAKNQAKRILVHYFNIIAQDSGTRLDSDCIVEIEGIVDDIIEAVKAELKDEYVSALQNNQL